MVRPIYILISDVIIDVTDEVIEDRTVILIVLRRGLIKVELITRVQARVAELGQRRRT